MKKITINVSDKLYSVLEGMCETDRETPESIAAALVYEKLYEEEIDDIWEKIDNLIEEEKNSKIRGCIERICDILTYSAYSIDMPVNESLNILNKLISLVKVAKEDEIINLLSELEVKLGNQVPKQEELDKYRNTCECNHNDEHHCGCKHC